MAGGAPMKPHVCQSHPPKVWRMILAKLAYDDDGYRLVRDELGDCLQCWKLVADMAMSVAASGLFLQAMGLDKAIASAEKQIKQELMYE